MRSVFFSVNASLWLAGAGCGAETAGPESETAEVQQPIGSSADTHATATMSQDGSDLVSGSGLLTASNGLILGTGCTNGAQCDSGFCVDGVCCDSACTDTCKACTAAKKRSGADGACGTIKFDTDPDEECGGGACDGKGTCKFYNGVPCTNTSECLSYCVDGFCCGNICSGTCKSCSAAKKGYGYNGVCGTILAGTDPDNECPTGVCSSSATCAWGLGLGSACTSNGDCALGFCVDGVCCDSACTDTCKACTAAKKGSGADGTCGTIKFDTDPDEECLGGAGACDGKGTCKLYNGVPCTNTSECLSYCVEGFCCGNVCTGACESCSAAIRGDNGFNGICRPIAANTDPKGLCGGGTCDGAGQCGGATGTPCKDIAMFQAVVVPQMQSCNSLCHGGKDPQATVKMDLSQLNAMPPSAACAEVRAHINPSVPDQSAILTLTDPTQILIHKYKFQGNLNEYNAFKDAVIPWILSEQ